MAKNLILRDRTATSIIDMNSPSFLFISFLELHLVRIVPYQLFVALVGIETFAVRSAKERVGLPVLWVLYI